MLCRNRGTEPPMSSMRQSWLMHAHDSKQHVSCNAAALLY